MKKVIVISVVLLALMLVVWLFWDRLPIAITRYYDIKLGNQVAENVNAYKNKQRRLPDASDYPLLRRLGFDHKGENTWPEYHQVNDSIYELIFVEGFDGPYLMWNSNEKEWKISNPTFDQTKVK